MLAYYNEIDPFKAEWLRQLISAGNIANGVVDERSIADVKPSELTGYTQCHFFAGIGAWSYALRQAGWPYDRPVWTGSCPCPSFSSAGKGKGFSDPRHLWPELERLIRECKPDTIFGEQVATAIGHGWFDLISTDLENQDYTVGSCVLGAHSVGAPHIRQRLYFVANNKCTGLEGYTGTGIQKQHAVFTSSVSTCTLADNGTIGRERRKGSEIGNESDGTDAKWIESDSGLISGSEIIGPTNSLKGFWRNADWIGCRDGKWRPVEPGTFPLAHGSSCRVGRLRGYGDAIVAPTAQAFIESYLEVEKDLI